MKEAQLGVAPSPAEPPSNRLPAHQCAGVLRLPCLNIWLTDLCDLREQVHSLEQKVNVLRLKNQFSFLRRQSNLPLHGQPAQQHQDRQCARLP